MKELENDLNEIGKLIQANNLAKKQARLEEEIELAKYNSASTTYQDMVKNTQDYYDMMFKNITSYSAYLTNLINIFAKHEEYEKCSFLKNFKTNFEKNFGLC